VTLYQVVDWDHNYENAKSRTIEHKAWCAVPNKQDGLGLARLLQEKNGPAMYGAFVATVLMLSRQGMPREGYLTDTGRADGMILTPDDIALVIRMPVKLVAEMLEATSRVNIGWLRVYNTEDSAVAPQGQREDTAVSPKKDWKEGTGQDRKDGVCPEPQAAAAQSPTQRIGFDGSVIHGILESDTEEWRKAYPAVDIPTEICRAKQWLIANPKKKKKNVYRFLVNWLNREQERGGSTRANRTRAPVPSMAETVKAVRGEHALV